MDTTPLQHVDVLVISLYRQKKNGRVNGEYACCHKLIFHLLDEKQKMLNELLDNIRDPKDLTTLKSK